MHLIGEVDPATCDLLAAALGAAARPGHDLIVDCARLEFIDAAGIAVLVHAAGLISEGRLHLTNVRAEPAELIDLLDLSAAVPNLCRDTA